MLDLFDRTRALTKPQGAVLSTAVEERQVDPDSGFAPKQFDPASQDPRLLGIWVELLDKGKPPS